MTNFTERVKDGSAIALKYLENGDSVRRACQKAGISVTSLYHSTTPEQREQAYLANSAPATTDGVRRRGPGRRRKVKTRRPQIVISSENTQPNEVNRLQKELNSAYEYISKLEHKLVKSIVFPEIGQ